MPEYMYVTLTVSATPPPDGEGTPFASCVCADAQEVVAALRNASVAAAVVLSDEGTPSTSAIEQAIAQEWSD